MDFKPKVRQCMRWNIWSLLQYRNNLSRYNDSHGPPTINIKLRLPMRRECRIAVTLRVVLHAGIVNSGFLLSQWRGKTFPAFPAHAQPAIYISGDIRGSSYCDGPMFVMGIPEIPMSVTHRLYMETAAWYFDNMTPILKHVTLWFTLPSWF